jgi:tRNA-uridine 2-sulfurtransferase
MILARTGRIFYNKKVMSLNRNKKEPVLVAMSGGVDSSIAAALLLDAGYDVAGGTMIIDPEHGADAATEPTHVQAAALVASKLGIRHHLFDLRKQFAKLVIDDFTGEYLSGRTPNPCVRCNQRLKFGLLAEQATALGYPLIATGHYVINECDNNEQRCRLLRGADRGRDQSYFLFTLGQEVLQRTLFPLGLLQKVDVKAMAAERGLADASGAESRDICFAASGYLDFLGRHLQGKLPGTGEIVDVAGKILGEHRGIHRYTIGQRKGLGIGGEKAYYVVALAPADSKVIVGDKADLISHGVRVLDPQWVAGKPIEEQEILVQVRYRHRAVAARLEKIEPDSVTVVFDRPVEAITPGQAAVFYRGEELIGGGWIERGLA